MQDVTQESAPATDGIVAVENAASGGGFIIQRRHASNPIPFQCRAPRLSGPVWAMRIGSALDGWDRIGSIGMSGGHVSTPARNGPRRA